MKQRSSLKRVLIIPVILIVVGVSLTIGWISFKAGNDAVTNLTQRILNDMVQRIALATEKHLDGAVIALESIAPDVSNLPREYEFETNLTELEPRLWSASGLFMNLNNYVYFGSKQGSFVGVYRIAPNNVQVFWRDEKDSKRHVYQARFPNDKQTLLREDDFDPRKRPWFQAAMNSNQAVWSKIYNNFSFHYPTITLSKPVYGKDHEFVGVVATDLTLKELSSYLHKLDISENAVAYIVDAEGYVVATSGEEIPERWVEGKPVRLHATEMKTQLIAKTFSQIKVTKSDPLLKQSLSIDGESVDVAVVPLGSKQGLEWRTVVALPRSDYMSNVNRFFWQSLIISIGCVAFALTTGLTIVHRVVRDIRKLTNAVQIFGAGGPVQSIDIRRNDEIGMLAKAFVEMEHSLRFDKLTKVANREALFKQIDFFLKNAKDNPEQEVVFTLLFIDLDRFKKINDQHGHDIGDKVLVVIAARLASAVRDSDIVARYGGDEFVLLLNGIRRNQDIETMVEKICTVVEQPILIDALTLDVGASVGWASFPDDSKEYSRLLKIADSRMYNRKRDRHAQVKKVV